MNTFEILNWWPLALLLLLPVAWLRHAAARRRAAAILPTLALARAAGSSMFSRTRWLLPVMRTTILAILVVSLARPVLANQRTSVWVDGVAIELVVDRSGSMQALDFTLNGQRVDRLTAIKDVASKFVLGGDGLDGRPNDLVGLVTFATFADSLSPLTLDHDHLIQTLERSQIAVDASDGGTAIGDAVALGVERLRDVMEGARREDGRSAVRSAVLILLTDGEDNASELQPQAAAELAKALGIKLYTIGVGTHGTAPFPVQFLGRTQIQQVPVTIDEELLKQMASETGGKYFRATDTASLAAIYSEIDALEKTHTEQQRTLHYKDLAVQPFRVGGLESPPLLFWAALLLGLELVLGATRYRTLPG